MSIKIDDFWQKKLDQYVWKVSLNFLEAFFMSDGKLLIKKVWLKKKKADRRDCKEDECFSFLFHEWNLGFPPK